MSYADQRFYASTYGSFLTPDRKAGKLSNPGSLNRYAYVGGDPVNKNDPRGLCSVMVSGITMGPGTNADWTAEAASLGADTAYPYSGQGTATSIGSVISQLTGPNAATYTAYYEILAAEASSSNPVDIIAYSGGGGAFAAAWQLLTPAQQADIGTIVYLAPGSFGATLPSNGSTSTFVGGAGPVNAVTGVFTSPVGTVHYTSCDHTDLGCLFGTAAGPLGNIAADGSCSQQSSMTRQQAAAIQAAIAAAAQRQTASSWWQTVDSMAGMASSFLDWLDSIPVGGYSDNGYAVDETITYDWP